MMKRIISWAKKNEGLVAGLVAMLVLVAAVVACQPTTTSPIDGSTVTRSQLQQQARQAQLERDAEVASLLAEAKAVQAKIDGRVKAIGAEAEAIADGLVDANEDLARKEEALRQGFDAVTGIVESVPGPWGEVLATAMGAGLLFLGYDNRRKDAVIKGQKLATPPSPTPAP